MPAATRLRVLLAIAACVIAGVFVLGFVVGRVTKSGGISAKAGSRVYVGRLGDEFRVPSVAMRCQVSVEGGFRDLFCRHTPTSHYDISFFADSFLVYRAGNPDSPVFVGRFKQRQRGSEREKAAILLALPRYLRVPMNCAKTDIEISSDPSWARAEAIDVYDFRAKKCGRFAGNGYWLLKKSSAGRWRIAFNGSEVPQCSVHAPKDLLFPGMKSCGK